jgi:hypothetical protein
MKLNTFDMMRVWAAVTGILLAAVYFLQVYEGVKVTDMLPMLITAIGGFELFLFSQDFWLKRSGGSHG